MDAASGVVGLQRRDTRAGRLRRGAAGVNGATVQLLRGSAVIRTARTTATGAYTMRLTRLRKGTYTVRTRSTVPAQDLGTAGCVTAISAAPCLGDWAPVGQPARPSW